MVTKKKKKKKTLAFHDVRDSYTRELNIYSKLTARRQADLYFLCPLAILLLRVRTKRTSDNRETSDKERHFYP